jgi:hypothetical protein
MPKETKALVMMFICAYRLVMKHGENVSPLQNSSDFRTTNFRKEIERLLTLRHSGRAMTPN